MKIAGFWKSSPQLLWTNGYRDIMIYDSNAFEL